MQEFCYEKVSYEWGSCNQYDRIQQRKCVEGKEKRLMSVNWGEMKLDFHINIHIGFVLALIIVQLLFVHNWRSNSMMAIGLRDV